MGYDALAVIAIWFVATAIAVATNHGQKIAPHQWWFSGYLILVAYGYFAYCWRRGHTLGMRSWKIRITDAAGGPVTWRQTLIRFGVAALGGLAGGFGYWWALFDTEGRAWHDRASATRLMLFRAKS